MHQSFSENYFTFAPPRLLETFIAPPEPARFERITIPLIKNSLPPVIEPSIGIFDLIVITEPLAEPATTSPASVDWVMEMLHYNTNPTQEQTWKPRLRRINWLNDGF